MKVSPPVFLLIAALSPAALFLPGCARTDRQEHGSAKPKVDEPGAALKKYGIYEETAPMPGKIAPGDTALPLRLRKGDHVVFIGNTLFDRGAQFPYFEALLQLGHPNHNLVIRTLAWSADEPGLMPRPKNFGNIHQHLTVQKADVIFAAFGFNESFAGVEKLPEFRQRLTTMIQEMKASAYNGRAAPRIVLVSPTANENVPGVPAADLNNARIAAYTRAMAAVAAEQKVGFANVFDATLAAMANPATALTFNGVHLEDAGYAVLGDTLYRATFGTAAPKGNAELHAAIVDKNQHLFRRYRPLDTFYYTGDRNKGFGEGDFLPVMRNFDLKAANRDQRIWEIARGKSFGGRNVDDANVPPLPPTVKAPLLVEWLSPKDELAAFTIDPRFEVNLFASEEQFPELANPIQMRWDHRGRLWVSCSPSYPDVYGEGPRDRIIILEDNDGDGQADTCSVFADKLRIPLAFEFGDGGVYVTGAPHLVFLKDTDGDGKADLRRQVLTGFGMEDSHHGLHDFVWTPDGDLLFRDSIFLHTQVETPYGPVRAYNSAWFQFRPETHKLVSFGSYRINSNPWGVTFDGWGHQVASDPIFANAFHATNAPYPEQHPAGAGIPGYSGTAGQEFVDFDFWPKELQGGFIKARYKPSVRIEMHRWVEKDDHFEEDYLGDIIFSKDLSFVPTDVKVGPRGDMYICDFYNPIVGQTTFSLRDERRDAKSGRIWRIVPTGAKLAAAPQIAGAPVPALLELLKSPHYRQRYWARRELYERPAGEVKAALDTWVAHLDPKDSDFRHHQIEAIWTYRTVGAVNAALLRDVLSCDSHLARSAATKQLRYWSDELGDGTEQLRQRANDENSLVRMEAVIAASYLGTREALEAVVGVLDRPAGRHLKYAIRTAFGSENLSRHWNRNETNDPTARKIAAFFVTFDKDVAGYGAKGSVAPSDARTRADKLRGGQFGPARLAQEAAFDNQKDVARINIKSVPALMLFDVTAFSVKPGQPVKLTFTNPDAMAHNLVVVKPGAESEVGLAGNEMAKDPDGAKKDFIPTSDKVLFHTKLIDPGQIDVLRFRAPKEPGDYPYICTFPGHWVIMRGMMHVAP
ncbi:MAG: hypothetical protein HY736_02675 [Verrucomicrobia bacterium]|nr:hypothetical protein [Verrucomicrobiota bacterium]